MVITAKNIGHFVIAFSLFQISCGNNDSNSTHVTIPESETNQYQSDTVGAAKNHNPEVLNIEEHIRYRKKWYREQGDSMVLDTSTGDVITVDIKIQEGKLYYKNTKIVGGTQKAWFSEMESNLKKNGAVGVSGGCDHTIYNYNLIVEGVITITSKTEFGDNSHPTYSTYYIKLNSGSRKSITKINELWMGNDGTKISGDDKIISDESRELSGCYFVLSNRENRWELTGSDL